ncbi:hypothetical protein [Flavobacterium sp. Arc2]|uniref:hypothetical protein n=1 Tax=Flavobacterium sp. Arc2 TaxID=3046685 RepID=UPI00352CA9FA
MNKPTIFLLKALRKLHTKSFGVKVLTLPKCEENPNKASQIIYDVLTSDKPCMIARFGSNELLCLVTYMGVKENNRNLFTYITSKSSAWWWNEENLKNMHIVAGFFPPKISEFEKFGELMLQDIPEVDVLASWLENEQLFDKELQNSTKIGFELLNPYFSSSPWTKALEGKKILVVHPFAKTIEQQYKKRELLFKDDVLPDFELKTVQAVLSLADNPTQFNDWFEALDFMKTEIDKQDYDICLIGCGAYGFHLAAHVKRHGKKAVHMGGSLQMLFGIRGKRWEDPNYNPIYNYYELMNEYWVKPNEEVKPKNVNAVEGACYW